jgi:hypothetical protein
VVPEIVFFKYQNQSVISFNGAINNMPQNINFGNVYRIDLQKEKRDENRKG